MQEFRCGKTEVSGYIELHCEMFEAGKLARFPGRVELEVVPSGAAAGRQRKSGDEGDNRPRLGRQPS
jgi:hypothetical protein